MVFEFLDLKPRNPYLSIALDEALCLYYGKQKDFLGGIRLWSNSYSVILGRTCKAKLNVQPDFLSKHEIFHTKSNWSKTSTLCRRASGGGTVLHGPGGINFSLFLPMEKHPELYPVKKSYEVLLPLILDPLNRMGIEARMEGQSDIVMKDENGEFKKISGNAQFRKHGMLMHHGTLITHRDLIEFIARSLLHPPAEPAYRAGRVHEQFLGALPESFDIASFYNSLSSEFRRFVGAGKPIPTPALERRDVFLIARRLAYRIYANNTWILDGKYPGST